MARASNAFSPLAVVLLLLFASRASATLDVVKLPYAADKYAVIDAEVSNE